MVRTFLFSATLGVMSSLSSSVSSASFNGRTLEEVLSALPPLEISSASAPHPLQHPLHPNSFHAGPSGNPMFLSDVLSLDPATGFQHHAVSASEHIESRRRLSEREPSSTPTPEEAHYLSVRSSFERSRRRLFDTSHWDPTVAGQVEYDMLDGCCDLSSERGRVRTAGYLNWALYDFEYDEIYDDKKQVAAWHPDVFDENLGYGRARVGDTSQERAKNAELYQKEQKNETKDFWEEQLTQSWTGPRQSPQSEYNGGSHKSEGVCFGVYTDLVTGERMIAFRGSYSDGDFNNILKWMKDWIVEKMGPQVERAWVDAGGTLTSAMKKRRGNDLQSRCAVRAATALVSATMSQSKLAKLVNEDENTDHEFLPPITEALLNHYGYWEISKRILRKLMPEDRNKLTEPNTYFTGHSQGGATSSLASMWLEKVDNKKYQTYSISPLGVQCFSRRLSFLPGSSDGFNYLDDVDPYISHDQIVSYIHPFDFYAGTDYQPGKVCHYGNSLTWTDREGGQALTDFVEKMVGYSGSVLMYDGFQKKPSHYFRQTRYWTHTMDYMNMLFASEEFLSVDGVTDGGCEMADIIPKGDPDNMCPTGKPDKACYALFAGVGLTVLIVIIVIPTLLFCYFCHCCCFKRHKKDGKTHFERSVKERLSKKDAKVLPGGAS